LAEELRKNAQAKETVSVGGQERKQKENASSPAAADIGQTSPASVARMGLAKIGSNAALSFAFAFLRRAWLSGADADLCSDLLDETLQSLRSLPDGGLYGAAKDESVWPDVVDRMAAFLRALVEGEDLGAPARDRHTALLILLEFALQKADLRDLLDMCLLMMRSQSARNGSERGIGASAPIISFLKRIHNLNVRQGKSQKCVSHSNL